MASEHDKVHIRKTNPGLYLAITISIISHIASGWNLWASNPTFIPYGISKNLVGTIFILFGMAIFIFLNVYRNLPKLRLTLAVSIMFLIFWGLSNTEQWRAGNASLALPIFLWTIAAFQARSTVEAPVSLMSETV